MSCGGGPEPVPASAPPAGGPTWGCSRALPGPRSSSAPRASAPAAGATEPARPRLLLAQPPALRAPAPAEGRWPRSLPFSPSARPPRPPRPLLGAGAAARCPCPCPCSYPCVCRCPCSHPSPFPVLLLCLRRAWAAGPPSLQRGRTWSCSIENNLLKSQLYMGGRQRQGGPGPAWPGSARPSGRPGPEGRAAALPMARAEEHAAVCTEFTRNK